MKPIQHGVIKTGPIGCSEKQRIQDNTVTDYYKKKNLA
jgi:hypothetical protein